MLALVASAALGLGCSDEQRSLPVSVAQSQAAHEREEAPPFDLARIDGGRVELAALRGKIVVLDFWATWCPPCEFQVPELNAFYEAHRASGDVEVIGISIDTDGPEVVAEWCAEKDCRYPIVMGDEDLARRYGALGFPALFVVAPDGTIDSSHQGLIERADLESAVARLREGGSEGA